MILYRLKGYPSKEKLQEMVRIIKADNPAMTTPSAIRTTDLWTTEFKSLHETDPYFCAVSLFHCAEKFPEEFDSIEKPEPNPYKEAYERNQRYYALLKQAVKENDGEKALEFCRFYEQNPGFGCGSAY